MNGYLRHIITVHTTPKELRDIADRMEEKWPTLRPGDSTVTSTMFVDNYVTIEFAADQEKMRKNL
jgi:hypothetical protein